MPSFNLKAIHNALQAQIVALSALPDGQVVFANQNARAPGNQNPLNAALDYISIQTNGPFTVGGQKYQAETYDGTKPNGQEIQKTVQGPARMTVSVQAYTVDFEQARQTLQNVQAGLQTRGTLDALIAAGITFYDFGSVLDVPKPYGSAMEGRAVLDLGIYVQQVATSKQGYILTVGGSVPTATGQWNPPGGGPTGTFTD